MGEGKIPAGCSLDLPSSGRLCVPVLTFLSEVVVRYADVFSIMTMDIVAAVARSTCPLDGEFTYAFRYITLVHLHPDLAKTLHHAVEACGSPQVKNAKGVGLWAGRHVPL